MVDIKPVTSVTTPTAIDDLSLHDALPIYEAGAKLALGAGISDDVCGWLLQIRERFDGQGPDGLAGEAIPIASRIARADCACDTLLASPETGETLKQRQVDAATRLRAAAGQELDPAVVEALAGTLERASG